MKTTLTKRLFSALLAASLMIGNVQPIFASANTLEDSLLCPHHEEHTEACYDADGVLACGFLCEECGIDPASDDPTDPPEDPTDPPEDPTDPPEDPTDPPEDPTDPPEDPTDPPEDPTDPPEDPTDPPEDPTDPPEDPTDPPEDPTDPPEDPTDPPEDPTDPSEDPTDPSEDPTDPSEDPTDPSEDPTDPSEDPEETDEDTVEEEVEGELGILFPGVELPGNDEIFELYAEQVLYDYEISTFGTKARAGLNTAEKSLYDALKTKIKNVASNGGSTTFTITSLSSMKHSWTSSELGVSNVTTSKINSALAKVFSTGDIMDALLTDCPFDLYWFDKTIGMAVSWKGTGTYTSSGVCTKINVTSLTFTFYVANDYRGGSSTKVTTNMTAVKTARAEAKAVVDANASKTGYEKYVAYKNYICNAVSYNDAAIDYNYSYGNPWQVIYVFDKNSSTNVVCEGYSKAFQYLCDLGGLDCISVSGDMVTSSGSGAHMWNVVTIAGKNYLVDVTNTDSGMVGSDGSLFLVGSSYRNGRYSFTCSGRTVQFVCENLNLATSRYSTSTCAHEYNLKVVNSKFLKTAPTTTTKAVYYKSCVCGAKGTSTFTHGSTKLYAPVLTSSNSSSTGDPIIKWKKIDRATKYEVYRATSSGGSYSRVQTTTSLSYTDTGATAGKTYYYKVMAIASDSTYNSAYSAVKSVASKCARPEITISLDSASGKPVIKWSAISGAAKYEVYRATSSGGTYSKIGTTASTSYTPSSAKVGTRYYYKVKAIGSASAYNSAYSAVKYSTAKCAQPVITVSSETTSGKPYIKWSKISGAAKYEIYRATSSGGTYSKIKTTTSTSYSDTSAKLGSTYYYKVRAVASSTTYNSVFSAVQSCIARCAKPVVTVKSDSATGKPVLSWASVSGAKSYEVWRATSETGSYSRVASGLTGTSYTDSNATRERTYWYKVKAIGSRTELNSADSAVKKIQAALERPVVTFQVDSVSGKPTLSWQYVPGAVEYKVYRSTSATTSYKLVKTTTSTSFQDTSASVGKGYYYKVKAVGSSVSSAYSSYKKLTAKCAQPAITVTASSSSGKPYIKWGKISGAAKYEIYRATSYDGTYSKIKTTTAVSYTDTAAKVGSTYYYKVKAVASTTTYNSIFSTVQSCTAKCAKPSVTVSKVASTGKPTLSWNAVTGAVNYEIWRSVNGGSYSRVARQTATTYTDNNAVVDRSYTYKVIALGSSSALNSAEAVTSAVVAACAKPTVKIALKSSKPNVSWDSVDGAVKYYVYRSTSASGTYSKIKTVTGTSYNDTTAKKGYTYYYKIKAVSNSATSAYSSYVKITSK